MASHSISIEIQRPQWCTAEFRACELQYTCLLFSFSSLPRPRHLSRFSEECTSRSSSLCSFLRAFSVDRFFGPGASKHNCCPYEILRSTVIYCGLITWSMLSPENLFFYFLFFYLKYTFCRLNSSPWTLPPSRPHSPPRHHPSKLHPCSSLL